MALVRRRVLGGVLALALFGAVPAGAPAAPTASAACTSATIGGRDKCIARGQFCAKRYASQYRRYGLSCTKLDRNGRYRLT